MTHRCPPRRRLESGLPMICPFLPEGFVGFPLYLYNKVRGWSLEAHAKAQAQVEAEEEDEIGRKTKHMIDFCRLETPWCEEKLNDQHDHFTFANTNLPYIAFITPTRGGSLRHPWNFVEASLELSWPILAQLI